mgnify:CR=1 FL=1
MKKILTIGLIFSLIVIIITISEKIKPIVRIFFISYVQDFQFQLNL